MIPLARGVAVLEVAGDAELRTPELQVTDRNPQPGPPNIVFAAATDTPVHDLVSGLRRVAHRVESRAQALGVGGNAPKPVID